MGQGLNVIVAFFRVSSERNTSTAGDLADLLRRSNRSLCFIFPAGNDVFGLQRCGWRSLLLPACSSHCSADRRASPCKTKLLFLPFAFHSIALVSKRVCSCTHLRSVSSALISVSVAPSKSSVSRQ